MSGERHELEIIDLAFDGKAVAHLDGKVVFCNAGLPGEKVLVEITRSKPRYAQARVCEIITRSPERIEAVCSHFAYCGGCTWQDLEYQQQLHFKKHQVNECLARIGGLEAVEVADILPADPIFRYRNKMEFSFHCDGDHPTLGLHERGRFDRVFDLEACYLQSEEANRIVDWVRKFVERSEIEVYNVKDHTGYVRFLVIRQTAYTNQLMVSLVTNYGPLPHCDKFVAGLTEEFPSITTIIHGQNDKKSNIAVAEIETVLFGPGRIEEELLGLRFQIQANSFFQTNSRQAEQLYEVAFELLDPKPSDRLLDLYCGTGTIGLLLASRVSEVLGIELVPEAVAMARANAEANNITNATFEQGPVRDFLKAMAPSGSDFDAVVIDPPRSGLHPKALKGVIRMKPPRLLYISCNPATFARDAKLLLDSGYEMSQVRPVDMFPHTRHVELVALFHC